MDPANLSIDLELKLIKNVFYIMKFSDYTTCRCSHILRTKFLEENGNYIL